MRGGAALHAVIHQIYSSSEYNTNICVKVLDLFIMYLVVCEGWSGVYANPATTSAVSQPSHANNSY